MMIDLSPREIRLILGALSRLDEDDVDPVLLDEITSYLEDNLPSDDGAA